MQAHIAKPVSSDDIERIVGLYMRNLGRSRPALKNPKTTDVEELPPALHDRYRARKNELLVALHSQAGAQSIDESKIADLAEKLHKIGGSADHFGDAVFGKAALELERALRASSPPETGRILDKGAARLQKIR